MGSRHAGVGQRTVYAMTVPDLLDPGLLADPYTGFGRLREQAAVIKGRNFDGSSMWYVTRQTDVRTVLSDPRFVNNPSSVPGGVGSDARAAGLAKLGVPGMRRLATLPVRLGLAGP
jgi:cytochrome P450